MLRKLLIAGMMSSALALAACSVPPVPGSGGAATVPALPSIDPATIAQIKNGVITACSYVPTAQTVADIIATFAGASPLVDVVGNAVQGVCAAIQAKGFRRGGPLPKYRGVVIKGHRV